MNANDAAATAKHMGLTAAKILFAQTAKGQDVLTDDDKALVERLRWSDGWFFENPWDHVVYASDDPLEAADRIEAQAAEIERLREAMTQIARLRTDLSGDFSLGSKQSDIARAALSETLHVSDICKENGESFT